MKIYDKNFLPMKNYINKYTYEKDCVLIDIKHPEVIEYLKVCGFKYYNIKEIFILYIVSRQDFSCFLIYGAGKQYQLTHTLHLNDEEKSDILAGIEK